MKQYKLAQTDQNDQNDHVNRHKYHNQDDPVNHPSHYKLANGTEVIDVTENLNFCRGNAVKYLCRAGHKDPAKEIEDLKKAEFYVKREISRLIRLEAIKRAKEQSLPAIHLSVTEDDQVVFTDAE